jgi:protoheme ferro-lyase
VPQSLPNDAFTNPLGLNKSDPQQDADAVEAHFKAQLRTQFDEIMNTAMTYGSPAGQKELQRLRRATIESAAWMPSLALQHGIEAANAHAYAREGQNALVRQIEERIELAKRIKTPEDLHDLIAGSV